MWLNEKNKNCKFDSESLYEIEEAMKVQRVQFDELEAEKEAIGDGLEYIDEVHRETRKLAEEVSTIIVHFYLNNFTVE